MSTIRLILTCIAISFAPVITWATLGESVKAKNAVNLSSQNISQKAGAGEKYTVYEYEQNGNIVKEFSSLEGFVFAVSWRGVSQPNLDELFGAYYKEYDGAFQKIPKQFGKKSLSIKTSQMVIRRTGRMRDQRGFVYVPSLVPEGVNVELLQ